MSIKQKSRLVGKGLPSYSYSYSYSDLFPCGDGLSSRSRRGRGAALPIESLNLRTTSAV
jgi:hypothetical protein